MRYLILIATFITLTFSSFELPTESVFVQSQELVVIKAFPAIYPPIAAVAEESGIVTVEVEINSDGAVTTATAVDGHKLFRLAAENGAKRWLFEPVAESKGLRTTRLTFYFKFIPRTASQEDLLPVFLPPYGVEIRGTTTNYILHKNIDPPNIKTKKPSSRKP